MLSFLTALLTVWAIPAEPWREASQAPPATEVFVAALSVRDGKVSVGEPENISRSPGYDNQPFFAPDGATLFSPPTVRRGRWRFIGTTSRRAASRG